MARDEKAKLAPMPPCQEQTLLLRDGGSARHKVQLHRVWASKETRRTAADLERLLVVRGLALGGDLKALLGRIEDDLDLLDQTVLLLLKLGILVDRVLHEQLDVAQLAEV
ncbi:hypothetical protein MAPG_04699, partial [Magnaporthiopsis poae ATCC 64411]